MDNSEITQDGLTQRGVKQLFERIEQMKVNEPTRHYSVFVSFLQIYNEKVFDLLNSNAIGTGPAKQRSGVGSSNTLDA